MLISFTKVRLLEFLVGAISLFFIPHYAFAQTTGATLIISPESATYPAGQTFTATIIVDSSQGFNTANATLSYDPTMLSATSVSKSSSAFSLWAVEPAFDNGKGTVSFEGGNTTPLTGKKTILTVSFKALKEGKTDVTFSTGSVLAADGKGTDILSAKNTATYTIGAKAVSADPPPAPPPAAGTRWRPLSKA